METLQNNVSVLSSMGTTQITVGLLLVGIILIWLIVRASRPGSNQNRPTTKSIHGHRHQSKPVTESSRIRSQTGQVKQSVTLEVKPDNSPGTEAIQQFVTRRPEKTTEAVANITPLSQIPQDSVLRRHYQADLMAKKQALSNPYPSDSVLRRHYEALHKLVAESSPSSRVIKLNVQEVLEPSVPAKPAQRASIIEQAIRKEEQGPAVAHVKPVVDQQSASTPAIISVPQDSVLKRHFISQLQTEIESGLLSRPSDSVLRRHYDSMVHYELKKLLAG